MTTTIRLIGGPTVLLEYAGTRILTDPTFSPVGVHESAPGRPLTKTLPPAVGSDELLPIGLVLLSHDQHADNLDPAGRELLASVPLTLTTPAAAGRLGGGARGLVAWEPTGIAGITVTAVPALHGPQGSEPFTGPVTGFVLEADGEPTIYVSGDNASLAVVSQIAEHFPSIDVAVLFGGAARTSLFDGAALTLTGPDVVEATQLLGVSMVVPAHTSGWAHFSEGPADVARAFDEAGHPELLLQLAPGETARLSPTADRTWRALK